MYTDTEAKCLYKIILYISIGEQIYQIWTNIFLINNTVKNPFNRIPVDMLRKESEKHNVRIKTTDGNR